MVKKHDASSMLLSCLSLYVCFPVDFFPQVLSFLAYRECLAATALQRSPPPAVLTTGGGAVLRDTRRL